MLNFTEINQIQHDLNWEPVFNLQDGLFDSYRNDYLLNPTLEPDFSVDKSLTGF